MTTLNQDIRAAIALLPDPPCIVDNWEPVVSQLSASFDWCGSKIDWATSHGHVWQALSAHWEQWLPDVRSFIVAHKIDTQFGHSNAISYINDSQTDFMVHLSAMQFDAFLALVLTHIPGHHYFFDLAKHWCLVISMEGYIDFGFAPRYFQPVGPYKGASGRIEADLDNERLTEELINLTQTDQVRTFEGHLQTIHAGDYVYLFYDISLQGDRSDLVFAEGIVVPYPFPPHHVKWCCKLHSPIEYEEEYRARLGDR